VAALGDQFAVDDEALAEAIRLRRSWTIFRLPSGLKIDLMLRQDSDYDREAFSRRRRFRIDVDIDPWVKSAADSVLKKLQWFKAGGSVSTTQWRDVVELLRVNGSRLDHSSIDRWAPRLDVARELELALSQPRSLL
jgi:hypothetical protein